MATRSDITERLSKAYPQLAHDDVKLVVTTLLEGMTSALSNGQRIEVRGFGSLSVGYRNARKGRNPLTGESVQVPGKNVVRWKAGRELREVVKPQADTF